MRLPSLPPLRSIVLLALVALTGAFVLDHVSATAGPLAAVGLLLAVNSLPLALGNLSLLGVNTLGTLTPDIVALTILDRLQKKYPMLAAFATDMSDQTAKYGATINARVVVKPGVSDYDTANGYVAGNAATADVPVTINKHKHVSLSFNEQEISGTNRRLADEQMEAATAALGEQVVTDAFALVTAANFTTTPITETINNTDRETLTAARKSMSNTGVAFPRHGFLNADAWEKLTNDTKIISGDFVPATPDYEGGILRGIAGFREIYEFPDLPTVGNMSGFFLNPAALVIATRIPDDPGTMLAGIGVPMPGTINVITDPATGLSIMVRYFYDMQKGRLQMTLTLMYGVGVGVQGQGLRLVTA